MSTKSPLVAFYERLLAPLLAYDDVTGDGCVSLEVRLVESHSAGVCAADVVSERGPFFFRIARLCWPVGMIEAFGLGRGARDDARLQDWVRTHQGVLLEGLRRCVDRCASEDRSRTSPPVYVRIPAPAGGVVLRGALLGLCATACGGDSSSSSDVSLLEEQERRLQAERDEVEERARRSAERDASLPTIMETHSHEAEAICEPAGGP